MRTWTLLFLVAVTSALVGCGPTKFATSEYPPFYHNNLKSIAIAPLRNATPSPGAGDILSDALTNALAANGTYSVFPRGRFPEESRSDRLQTTNAELARQSPTGTQAILVGTVNAYSATRSDERRKTETPIYERETYWDKHGRKHHRDIIVRYRTVVSIYTRIRATVSVSASLIEVPSGKVLYATAIPIVAESHSAGSPPRHDEEACLQIASNEVVRQLVRTFAVTRETARVDPKKALRTATGTPGEPRKYTNDFHAKQTNALLVLQLPPVCDRNRFRLTITHKKADSPLLSKELIWHTDQPSQYPFCPAKLAEQAGDGSFQANLYADEKHILTHNFKIKPEPKSK